MSRTPKPVDWKRIAASIAAVIKWEGHEDPDNKGCAMCMAYTKYQRSLERDRAAALTAKKEG